MRDWVADFDAAYESGITVQAAIEGRDAVLASGSRNRMPRATPSTSLSAPRDERVLQFCERP